MLQLKDIAGEEQEGYGQVHQIAFLLCSSTTNARYLNPFVIKMN